MRKPGFHQKVLWGQESGSDMKNFTAGCQKQGLDILFSISTNARTRWVSRFVPDRLPRCRITRCILECVYKILIEKTLHLWLRERHGSHAMTGTSHVTSQVTQDSKTHHGTIICVPLFTTSQLQSLRQLGNPLNADEWECRWRTA